jgi:xanthine/uracil permease
MTVCELTSRANERPWTVRSARTGRVRWLRELALIAALYVGYSVARLIGDADFHSAVVHARDLLALERLLHIDIEAPANAALAAWTPLAVLASYWYSLLHYVITPAVLVWAYRRHQVDYRRVRDALILASAIGLVGFTLLPMAPPRMLPGFVDTLASTSSVGWWGGDASAPRGLGALTNQLAAMPSLHVGWAVWVAWVVVTHSTRRWVRGLAVAYPIGTTLVVVATANHYLLDAVAGAAVVAVAIRLSGRLAQPRQARDAELADSEPVERDLLDGERVVGAGLGQRGRQ